MGLLIPPAAPARSFGLAKFSARQIVKPMSTGYAGGYGTSTCAVLYAAEAPFFQVRATLFNYYTASSLTIPVGAMCAAATAAPNNGYSPLNFDGSANSFTPMLFAGAASGTVPACAYQSGATNNNVPGLLQTDWTPIVSIPRNDGGTLPLFMLRAYASGSQGLMMSLITGAVTAGWPSVSQGRICDSYSTSGDYVSSNQGGFVGNHRDVAILGVAVEFRGAVRGLSVFTVGDSLTQGSYTTASQNGFGHLAGALVSTPSAPVSVVNAGFAGQQHAYIYSNASAYIAAFAPDVVVFPVYSPNDTYSQANVNLALARTAAIIDQCIAASIVPIITTALPWNSISSAQDNVRKAMNATVLGWAANGGVLVADFDAALTDGGSPAQIQSKYKNYPSGNVDSNNQHPSDAGHAAMAAALQPSLQRLLNGRAV